MAMFWYVREKTINKSTRSFPLHSSPVCGLRKRSSASHEGNVSEGKQLLGQGLCVPYQDHANRQDSAGFHLENEKHCAALKYFIIEKGSFPTESFVYNLAE